ncbi:uncharacterized protein LOC113233688 [Hyposmocoma kahamanoa]|uniref:uncharacterized protein LOC113233688 n=1 Tax=Hyposmocoma kahamanoa TaxID=1477025 RepID=UPI000E6D6D0E|nr:uncharacterized protein LOC113233688 [Hyposmocoma kahamanoa]
MVGRKNFVVIYNFRSTNQICRSFLMLITFKMAPHTVSANSEQIETLLNFLFEHKDLARGRLRSAEGKLQAKRLWEELCNTLNSVGGCTKTVKQWQKVWFDRKHLTKKAAAESLKSASTTGGCPSTAPHLSEWELKVLAILGDEFGEHQAEARVPAFRKTDEPMPSISSQASDPLYLKTEYDEPNQMSEPPSQPVSQDFLTSRRFSQSTRSSRRRRSAVGTDGRSRLLQLEEQRARRETVRNTELAGIRGALLQLCEIFREFLDKH